MIEIKTLEKKFINEKTINYKNYKFIDGRKYLILGASGCGKSTLLNIISGILSPTSGEVYIDNVNMTQLSQKQKDDYRIKNIGYIFQDFKLIDEMSVMDNINILKLEGIDTSNVFDILKKLDIFDKRNKKIKELSGGEKQRVAIARAIVKKPNVILADEPTGNLNYEIGQAVIGELVNISSGKILIVVSHDDRLSPYFDEIINMNEMISSDKEEQAHV